MNTTLLEIGSVNLLLLGTLQERQNCYPDHFAEVVLF